MSKPTFRERLRYKSDQFFQSGFTLQLVVSGIVLIGVITVFFVISVLLGVHPGSDFDIEPGARDPFWPSTRFWWVLTHVLESYWIERATLPQVLSLLMTLFNLLVLAALVGLFGSRIQQRLEQVRRGTSRVVEAGHIVILGWSGKALPIIRELNQGLEQGDPVFVIHTQRPLEEIDGKLKREFGRRRFHWVIRQGSMTDLKDLELLNIQDARTVIILSQDGDAQVIKSIMAVAHLVRQDSRPETVPLIIAEIGQRSMLRLAYAAAHDLSISIVQPAEYLSRIILQTARQQGLVNVYDELLSHFGNELHFTEPGALEGRPWREVQFTFPDAIPIGIMRGGVPVLAPSASENPILNECDTVVCIARNEANMRFTDTSDIPALPSAASVDSLVPQQQVRNLLILGWNDKAQPLLEEYAHYAETLHTGFNATIVSPLIPEWINIANLDAGAEGALRIELLREDPLAEGVLDRVQPQRFDAVVVLGELHRRDSVEDADTKVIMLLLLLRSMREQSAIGTHPFPLRQQIVAEILDSANKQLAESTGAMQDVIISNDLISKMMAQICRDPRTEFVMRDFFDESGKEIYMKPACWYVAEGCEVSFAQIQRAAVEADEIAIGISVANDDNISIQLNPEPSVRVIVNAGISVILISEHEGRRTPS